METETITNINQTQPWGGQSPYLMYGFDQAKNNYLNPAQYYPGQTYVPFSPQTETGLGMMQNRALQGSPVNQAASGMLTNTLNGGFLNNNPYLDAMYNQAAGSMTRNFRDAVQPGIDSQMVGAGRFGSGAWSNLRDSANQQLATGLGGMAANLYGNAYGQERQNQMQALQMAPSIANQEYYDAGQMLNAGNMVQQQAGNVLQSDLDRWNYNANLPQQNLQSYMGNVTGNYGQSSQGSQTSPLYQAPAWQGALGGGLAGYGLSQGLNQADLGFNINPWLGAGLGGLLGLFGGP